MAENAIKLYWHCANCLPDKPEDVTPQEWSRVQAGFTDDGIQAWCWRCDMQVTQVLNPYPAFMPILQQLRVDRSTPRHAQGSAPAYRQEGELNMIDHFMKLLET